jgi:hypothetical protein
LHRQEFKGSPRALLSSSLDCSNQQNIF